VLNIFAYVETIRIESPNIWFPKNNKREIIIIYTYNIKFLITFSHVLYKIN